MSNDDDDLLPLLVMAGVGYATGGFGLLGASGAATTAGTGGLALAETGALGATSGSLFSSAISSEVISAASLGANLYGSYAQNELAQEQLSLQGLQERAANAEQSLEVERNLLRTVSSIRNEAGSSGAELSSGSVQAALQSARSITESQLRQIGVVDTAQASSLSLQRKSVRGMALGGGVGSLFDYARRESQRKG